jgi:hypothetical protein
MILRRRGRQGLAVGANLDRLEAMQGAEDDGRNTGRTIRTVHQAGRAERRHRLHHQGRKAKP